MYYIITQLTFESLINDKTIIIIITIIINLETWNV